MAKYTIEQLLGRLRKRGAEQGATIYDICFRNAGVGITWYEQERVTTPEPKLSKPTRARPCGKVIDGVSELSLYTDAMRRRTREGLVTHRYYPTLRRALEGELKRLLLRSRDVRRIRRIASHEAVP
jgi:hypothetical protein